MPGGTAAPEPAAGSVPSQTHDSRPVADARTAPPAAGPKPRATALRWPASVACTRPYRSGADDSAFESMVVAVDVEGSLPLRLMQESDDGDVAARGALRRLTFRRQRLWRSLTPDALPPPSPAPRLVQVEEPRPESGGVREQSAPDAARTNLDALAHWQYGGE